MIVIKLPICPIRVNENTFGRSDRGRRLHTARDHPIYKMRLIRKFDVPKPLSLTLYIDRNPPGSTAPFLSLSPMNRFLFVCFFAWFSVTVTAVAAIACNATQQCPEDSPCCSQYGTCGTGSYCLGGCDIRYSYNLTACMPMPRMFSFEDSFENIDHIEKQTQYLGNASEADWVYTGYIESHDDALLLQMPNGTTGTVVSSTAYFWYGKVGATMKSSHERGVITAFITFSDVQDEIDYEFLGYNLTNPQTNFYAKGILNYTNVENSTVSDTFANWHYYEIDWQEEEIQWSIDGNVVRTLKRDDTWNETTERYDFPQTPSRVQFSLWPGGSSLNGLGTIEWAGGAIDWDSDDIQEYGYYYAYVKNVTVEVYDLPDIVSYLGNSSDAYHAFLYNSTDGNDDNIYLTTKKTWLGSGDATGFDPENDTDDEDEETETTVIVKLSGLKVTTKTSVKTKSATTTSVEVPNGDANGTTSTAAYTGGFVQNSNKSASPTTAASSNAGVARTGTYGIESILALFSAFGLGMFAYGM